MIFNGQEAKYIYSEFYQSGRVRCPAKLVALCQPLVEAIATDLSTSDRYREDLIQEGYIKLVKLVQERRFQPNGNPKGGDFHSWLSFSLRNTMISYLRKQQDYEEIPEDLIYELAMPNGDARSVQLWAIARFPQMPAYTIKDIALYIHDAMEEQVNKKSMGIMVTLQDVYSLPRSQAKLIFDSVRIYNLAKKVHEPEALAVAAVKKFNATLLPEVVLVTGKETAITLFTTFRHCKLEF